jgi:hypothetical protein
LRLALPLLLLAFLATAAPATAQAPSRFEVTLGGSSGNARTLVGSALHASAAEAGLGERIIVRLADEEGTVLYLVLPEPDVRAASAGQYYPVHESGRGSALSAYATIESPIWGTGEAADGEVRLLRTDGASLSARVQLHFVLDGRPFTAVGVVDSRRAPLGAVLRNLGR